MEIEICIYGKVIAKLWASYAVNTQPNYKRPFDIFQPHHGKYYQRFFQWFYLTIYLFPYHIFIIITSEFYFEVATYLLYCLFSVHEESF